MTDIYKNIQSVGEPLYSDEEYPEPPPDHTFFHCRITDPSVHKGHTKYIEYIKKHYTKSISSFIYSLEDVDTENEHLHIHFSSNTKRISGIRNWLRNTCHLIGRPYKGAKSQYSLKACRSIVQSAIYTCKDSSGCMNCCFGYSNNYSTTLINKYQNSSFKKTHKREWRTILQDFIDANYPLANTGYIPLHFNGTFIEGDVDRCNVIQMKIITFFIENNKIPPARGFMMRLLLNNKLILPSLYLRSIGLLFED